MRTFIFLCCATFFALTPNNIVSQNSKIKIEEDKTLTVDEVFDLIMNQTDYIFFYEEGLFKDFPKLSLKKGTIRTNRLLSRSLAKGNLDITVTDNRGIVIKKKSLKIVKKEQENQVSGMITDSNGVPIPGVNILLVGTNKGTQTDFDGKYKISANDGDVLRFTFIGYKSVDITVGPQAVYDFAMQESVSNLEEVVVVGYGTQKRTTVTGAITTINAKELKTVSAPNAAIALQGRVPGLQILSRPGPLAGPRYFQLRGIGSLGVDSSPLVLVDGVPGDINSINPEQIENISILKDAATTAIYGASAAGGIILITTKSGKSGKINVDVKIRHGINDFVNLLEPLTAREQGLLVNESRINAGLSPAWTPQQIEGLGAGTNWIKAVTRSGMVNEANLQISGGNDTSRFLLASNYVKEEGALIGNWVERFNTRLKVDFDLTSWFKLGLNVFGQHQRGRGGANFWSAVEYSSIIPEFLPDGRYGIIDPTIGGGTSGGQSGGVNPVQAALDDKFRGTSNFDPSYNLNTILTAELKFTEFLKFNTIVNYGYNFQYRKSFSPDYKIYDAGGEAGGNLIFERTPENRRASAGFDYAHNWGQQSFFSFNKIFNDVHDVSAIVGFRSSESNQGARITASRRDFANNVVQNVGQGSGVGQSGGGFDYNPTTSFSYFGKIAYSYDNKYSFEGSLSRDGSDRFGPKNKFGLFGGVGASWRISEEDFFKELVGDNISQMKFRANYGVVGNDRIGQFLYYSKININGNAYPFGNPPLAASAGAYQDDDVLPNESVKWETLKSLNIGMDVSFLKNWNLSFDWYDKTTEDLLYRVPVSSTTAFSSQWQNIGKLSNKGIEISLGFNKTFNKDLDISSRVIFSKNKNVVKELFNGRERIDGRQTAIVVGKSVTSIFGLKVLGIYESQAEVDASPHFGNPGPGDFIYEDKDGDGTITQKDYQVLGDAVPKGSFSWTNKIAYKNFDLGVHLTVDYGAQTSQWGEGKFQLSFLNRNNLRYIVGRWRGPGTSTNISRVQAGNFYNVSGSRAPASNFVSDSDFMRIRQIELGYNLPDYVLDKLGVKSLRIYGNTTNPFTFTKLYGWDPESGRSNQRGAESPIYRTINFGINLNF
ncbi:SusC/RagA family TonB-linked outer membrane protein [Flavivirga spongiicola]|uniref:TonB-dependent receptor n=1 Tax=Flavivirga spongiicola TaxID=421621 RepID=A0ABU7XWM5_9FLAO|nr:TonB-dependent receptor [Flavivirga sp. MEBiC05379]MDO5980185.1 TonB-dependent receptor [Flavivirga sp. MEBiC05379]